jgi:hypothetical protein
MPSIHDEPPAAVQNDLASLAQALDSAIPSNTDANLLIAFFWEPRSLSMRSRRLFYPTLRTGKYRSRNG